MKRGWCMVHVYQPCEVLLVQAVNSNDMTFLAAGEWHPIEQYRRATVADSVAYGPRK